MAYVEDFPEFLQEGTFLERKALIRNFVKGIEVVGDEATLTCTTPMPSDGATGEGASVLDFVQSGPPSSKRQRIDAGWFSGATCVPQPSNLCWSGGTFLGGKPLLSFRVLPDGRREANDSPSAPSTQSLTSQSLVLA